MPLQLAVNCQELTVARNGPQQLADRASALPSSLHSTMSLSTTGPVLLQIMRHDYQSDSGMEVDYVPGSKAVRVYLDLCVQQLVLLSRHARSQCANTFHRRALHLAAVHAQ